MPSKWPFQRPISKETKFDILLSKFPAQKPNLGHFKQKLKSRTRNRLVSQKVSIIPVLSIKAEDKVDTLETKVPNSRHHFSSV